MMASLSIPGLLVALTLPWCLGCIWVYWLLRRTGQYNAFVVLGQGYFLGVFCTTLVIRVWDLLGFALNFWQLALVLLVISGCGLALQRWRPGPILRRRPEQPTPSWHLLVGTLLLALIAWRHITLVQELLLRPLYAWDAWMNWAPKAIVWFYHGSLVDFVNPEAWLSGSEDTYTLGNSQASRYPITVPLIQLWGMLGVGSWDHSGVYLPWVIAPLALGLGLYGHLRLAGVALLPALVACYLLLSLPYLNVHAVLAGYADIWVAAAFCLAVCALYQWQIARDWGYAVLWCLMAALCSQLKNPGVVLALIVLFFGLRLWVNLKPVLEIALWVVVAALAMWALVSGFDLQIPLLGHLAFDNGIFEIGRFGKFELAYHAVGAAFVETFFVMINWHLLWYLLLPCACFGVYRCVVQRKPATELLPVMAAMAFVVVVFVFTGYHIAASNFVTLNRVLLYPVPALIFCIGLWFRRREAAAAELQLSFAGSSL
jgi:hypothetical protein